MLKYKKNRQKGKIEKITKSNHTDSRKRFKTDPLILTFKIESYKVKNTINNKID